MGGGKNVLAVLSGFVYNDSKGVDWMRIAYIGHSGFFVEGEHCCLLFDYYRGEIPALPDGKKLFVFASHRHHDHFNPEIFKLDADYWILGRDFSLSPGIRMKYGVDDAKYARCRRMKTDAQLDLDEIRVLALRSTDEGAAFVVEFEGKRIYHAGDLNQWVWREDEKYDAQMTRDYLAEIEKLRGLAFDCAFLPVDPRQDEDFYLGADSFIRMHQPKWVFPMHLWEDYDTIRRFREHDCAKGYRDTIVEIRKPGEDFEI